MTTGLDIPETGLSLRPGEQSGDPASKPTQIMRLNFVQSTLDDLIASLRKDEPVRLRLGKHPSILYAGKSRSFHAYPETHRSEIYHSSSDNRTLYFTGVLSHSLEVEKAKKATAATDQALANLEESLNAFERGKESKKTHMIQHPDELKALQAASAGSSSHRGPKSKAELEKDRLLRTAAACRSLTSSPTLGAPKSPAPVPTPTSASSSQTKTNLRLEAMKTPFIHLLAVRAVSTKFLARQTRSSLDDCTTLVQKYGVENRLNREKFDLKDKAYKDLDVWNFPYPTQEDRQEAIENAISAFDRLRISRTDKLWQMLLPKDERGKGKCLSRLNLRTGPVKKPPVARAAVDGADDAGKEGDTTGNETDRRNGSGVTSKGSGATPRSTSTAQKPRAEKEPAKRTTKGKSANNSTLTGRVTKKTGGKPPAAKSEGKFKSAEYVHDSDEDDDDMPDAPPTPPAQSQPPKENNPAPPKRSQAPAKPRSSTTAPTSKASKTQTTTPKMESSKAASSRRPPSRLSTSPQKPSPLGSSPPANASDVPARSRSNSNNQSSSSSSSSPLISQLARTNRAVSNTGPRTARPAAATNGAPRSVSVSNSLKRKAEPDRLAVPHAATGDLEHKRRRAVSTASSGGSTGSASPPMSQELLRQQLWDKSQQFKHFYAKYSALHNKLEAQANPSQADLDKLQKQHARLHRMKQEIWDEHERLRDGILS